LLRHLQFAFILAGVLARPGLSYGQGGTGTVAPARLDHYNKSPLSIVIAMNENCLKLQDFQLAKRMVDAWKNVYPSFENGLIRATPSDPKERDAEIDGIRFVPPAAVLCEMAKKSGKPVEGGKLLRVFISNEVLFDDPNIGPRKVLSPEKAFRARMPKGQDKPARMVHCLSDVEFEKYVTRVGQDITEIRFDAFERAVRRKYKSDTAAIERLLADFRLASNPATRAEGLCAPIPTPENTPVQIVAPEVEILIEPEPLAKLPPETELKLAELGTTPLGIPTYQTRETICAPCRDILEREDSPPALRDTQYGRMSESQACLHRNLLNQGWASDEKTLGESTRRADRCVARFSRRR
jgi:hypothetical protein